MPRLKQTLFIARSDESAQLYLEEHSGAIKVMTIPSLLSELAPEMEVLDPFISKLLLQETLKELQLEHFAYLTNAPESLSTMELFFRLLKLNRVGLEAFGYSSMKLNELEIIRQAFEERKQSLMVIDAADRFIAAVNTMNGNSWFEQFEEIVIDRFEEEGIRFYASQIEKDALDILYNFKNITYCEVSKKELKSPETFTQQHTYADEAVFALKAVRKLMEEGVDDTQIAIVVSNLSNYRRPLQQRADEYGIQLHFSSGTPLMASPIFTRYLQEGTSRFDRFYENFASFVKEQYENDAFDEEMLDDLKRTYKTIKGVHNLALKQIEQAKNLGLTPPPMKELVTTLAQERYIPASYEQSGIFVTEPNQMTQRRFEHLIFIGTDLVQFPPKSGSDFLCSARQREEMLFTNNTYKLSHYYYRQMMRNNAHIHLSCAEYLGTRKLSLSPIVDPTGCSVLDVKGFQGERDLLEQGYRYCLDERSEAYIESLVSPEKTGFDGFVQKQKFDSGVLSASTLGSYAKCPLRYLFTYQYRCEAISAERDEESLEASDIGTMFHSIAERFANEVKKRNIILPEELNDSVKHSIEDIAKEVFDHYMQKNFTEQGLPITLIHRIAYNDLLKGLYEEHHQKGLLIRFLEYIYDEGNLEHFYKSEQYFMLDESFEITKQKEKAFTKGFIDRIDKDDAEHSVRVIDYKTGKYTKQKEESLLEAMSSYKEFQLPLYLLYAKRAFADFALDAFLVSFRSGQGVRSYGHIGLSEDNTLHFDDEYETGLKEAIKTIAGNIKNGHFAMTPSQKNCEYCEFERICHKSVLSHKEVSDEV